MRITTIKATTLHLLPHSRGVAICVVDGAAIREAHAIELELSQHTPYFQTAPCATSPDHAQIAVALKQAEDNWLIRVFKIDHDHATALDQRDFALPAEFTPTCVCFHRDYLLVAGRDSKRLAGYFDLGAPLGNWTFIPLPIDGWYRKAIDALLVMDQNRIVAVDNIVYPKYLVELDVSGAPKSRRLIELPNHGAYEHIERAANGKRWLAILSSTGSSGGPRRHLSIMSAKNLLEHGWLKVIPTSYRDYQADEFRKYAERHNDEDGLPFLCHAPEWFDQFEIREWHDIAFCGEQLLIAAGADGVGILDLSKEAPFHSRTSYSKTFSRRCLEAIRYRQPDPQPDGEVVAISPIDMRSAVVVIKSPDGYANQVIEF